MEENSNETQEVKNTLTDDDVASSDEPLVSSLPPLTSSAALKEGGEGMKKRKHLYAMTMKTVHGTF